MPAPADAGAWVSRAGRRDVREAKASFRITPGSLSGLVKGRCALLTLGRDRPDLVDARMVGSDPRVDPSLEAAYESPASRSRLRYTVWAPGNCASVRLARQLAGDQAVLKVDRWGSADERGWYYPMLTPWRHYVPLTVHGVNGTRVDLERAIVWAREHLELVGRMVRAARCFARRHLSDRGRQCYLARLLAACAVNVRGEVVAPECAVRAVTVPPNDEG